MFRQTHRYFHKKVPLFKKLAMHKIPSKNPLWSLPFLKHEEQDNQQKENALIASLMTNKDWLKNKLESLDLPSVEHLNAKIAEIYPQFTDQFKQLSEGYGKMWDYLTMEDFRKIVEEIKKEGNDPQIHPELLKDGTVREGNTLSAEEQAFIKKRKQRQKEAFARLIDQDPQEIDERDIPIIGLASSGGGYRAMIGLTGYIDAMKQSGLWDCIMYFSGISGSCWTMALYYNQLTRADPKRLKHHLEDHVQTHWANVSNFMNVLLASPDNSKLLLRGAIQRYAQQKGDISLVDLFGVLMGGTLLTKKPFGSTPPEDREDMEKEIKQDTMEHTDNHKVMHLTGQLDYINDGQEPMPIYCVVRHDIAYGKTLEERIQELKHGYQSKPESTKDEHDPKQNDTYQWFEFTPYDMGCEEIEAWIPIWAFGRRFEHGQNKERLPEQTLDILMGMFGSAFAASLVHFYKEIRSFLPTGALTKMDETIQRYEDSISKYHPISPASFPNPFYRIPETFHTTQNKEIKRPSSLINSQQLYLMDAGMDNNIPFYPFFREGRDVDVIIAVDLSADIQTADHFDRAESYIKRRGIKGWPTGAGWPKDHSGDHYPLGSCTLFESESTEDIITSDHTIQTEKQASVTLAYFPFIVNKAFDPDFDPQKVDFCSTWNFVYHQDQVRKVTGLAEANWNDNRDKIKYALKRAWQKKRDTRLFREH